MINENIKNARKAKGISQEEMAVQLNVVRQTVSKWEKGLSVPDADVLIRIAGLLEVSVTELLGVTVQDDAVEDLAKELAHVNEQLALKMQDENLHMQAGKKRGMILLLSFIAMLLAMIAKNEVVSILLTGGCLLAAVIILYSNLALLTRVSTADLKVRILKVTTLFNIGIMVLTIAVIALNEAAILKLSGAQEGFFGVAAVCVIMIFMGFVAPKLPFNRHTGLRLPWTVQDEATWNLAHRIIGYISLPLVLLYLALYFTVDNVKTVSIITVLLWIGIPGIFSLAYWWKKR